IPQFWGTLRIRIGSPQSWGARGAIAIALASVSFKISVSDIYNKVNFEQVDGETAPNVGEVYRLKLTKIISE
ncbi:MAG TPA: hypothetical protein DDZ80_19250, partial [Cyanobacteria bacterium UBA8803]|nr:hypothetical protein [Cyanobacteria bacterium UBA8803]